MGIAERRNEEREQRRETIVRAALELYVEHGVEGSTLSDVAAQVNLSRGLVYFYFHSKEGLQRTIVADGLRILIRLFSNAADNSENGLDAIHEIGRSYIEFARSYTGYYRAISAFQASFTRTEPEKINKDGPELLAEIGGLAERVNKLLALQIERGQKDGSIRKSISDPMAAGLSLWFTTGGLIQALSNPSSTTQLGYDTETLYETGLSILKAGLSK